MKRNEKPIHRYREAYSSSWSYYYFRLLFGSHSHATLESMFDVLFRCDWYIFIVLFPLSASALTMKFSTFFFNVAIQRRRWLCKFQIFIFIGVFETTKEEEKLYLVINLAVAECMNFFRFIVSRVYSTERIFFFCIVFLFIWARATNSYINTLLKNTWYWKRFFAIYLDLLAFSFQSTFSNWKLHIRRKTIFVHKKKAEQKGKANK